MLSVVVLGDSTESLTNLSERVTAMGHCVAATACSYEEAQDLALRLGPDAILSDCSSGPELDAILSELRSDTKARAVAVILVATDEMAARLDDEPLPQSVRVITPDDEAALNAAFGRAHDRRAAVTHEFRSMDLYRTIAETSPDGIVVMALDGATLYSSPHALEMFGNENEDVMLGTNAIDLLAPADRARARGDLGRVASGENVRNVVYTALREDASRFVCEVSGSPIRNDAGEPVAVVVVIRDCTERVLAENDARTNIERLHTLLEGAGDMISLHDLEGRVLYYAGPSRFAVSTEQLAGARLSEHLGFLDGPAFEERVVRVGASGERATVEEHFVTGGGETLTYSAALSPVRNELGHVTAVSRVARNVTERVETERELEYASGRFRALVERSSDITLIIGPDMNISYASPSMTTILGHDPVGLVGTSSMSFVHPDDLAAAQTLLQLAGDSGAEVPQIVIRMRHSDGSWRSIEASFTDGRADSVVNGFLLNCRDVTDRVRAEKESRAIRKHMMKSQRLEAVGQLAAGVAHDFNNLLTVIDAYADITLGKMAEESQGRAEVEQIVRTSRRAAELTRQLLIVGRGQASDMRPMDLNRSITDVIGLLSRTIGESIKVSFSPQEKLWAISADAGNIGQVIMNLAVNAKNAMPDGGKFALSTENVTLEADDVVGMPGGREGRFVVLSVRDTGVGMSAAVLDRIFEPFYTTRDGSGGSGMGLAVVHGIVDQHRGWICVQSEPGEGTALGIYIPASSDFPDAPIIDEPGSRVAASGEGKRILLVEDDGMIRRLFREALAGHGYQVFDAGGMAEALVQFESQNGDFHLLFSDVMLPDGTGPELACRLMERKPELRVLLTTGYAGESLRTNGDECPDFVCLRKPYSISTLLLALQDAVA
ncbi:MAG: PAS domain S-box protein [Candidatus Eisenbacteria bacterium]